MSTAAQLTDTAATLRREADALDALARLLDTQTPPIAPKPSAATPEPVAGLQNHEAFFRVLVDAAEPFAGRMTQAQRDGCVRLCAAGAGKLPLGWMAYVLATAYHETAHTMEPVRERGGVAYLSKYDTGRLAELLGNTPAADGDGVKWAGRGDVQLTGATNYRRADAKLAALGLIDAGDLLADPDLALRGELSAAIIVEGMREGWFSGKRLNDFIGPRGTLQQFTNARRIVNGTDRAAQIAGYAMEFEEALIAGGWL